MTVRSLFMLMLLLAGGSLALPSPAEAAPQRIGPTEVDLLSEQLSVQPGQSLTLGLQFQLDPAWHVYWVNPGDAGLAPSLTWTLPEGFTAGDIEWPYPHSISLAGLTNYGYEESVLLPVTITVPESVQPGTEVTFAAKASWLICKEECLPGEAVFTITLPVTTDPPSRERLEGALFDDARLWIPKQESGWTAGVTSDADAITLYLVPPPGTIAYLDTPHFYPIDLDVIDYSAAQTLQALNNVFALTLPRSQFSDGAEVESLHGVFVWRDGEVPGQPLAPVKPGPYNAVELTATQGVPPGLADMQVGGLPAQEMTPPTTPVSGGTGGSASSVWQALLLAFLGGIILNLMPCVLPVLSLKIFGFVQHAGDDRKKTLMHGLVFTAGVVLSFWLLAGSLLLLRAGGQAVGLGFHLQSPLFLVGLCAFLFLFAMSLLGVFEIGATLMGVGSSAQGATGYTGSFLNGVTATVVATPCTAPFMGTALGFALSAPAWGVFAIFTALGAGMAAPYLVLSANPALLKFVPKPGPWMESFKQFMGFLLLATIVWLTWVLGQIAGINGMAALLFTLLLLGLGSWMLQRFAPITAPVAAQHRAQLAAGVVMVLGLAFGFAAVASAPAATLVDQPAIAAEAGGIPWMQFSQEKVAELTAAGRPVFIDFTAAWCLSCQANERFVLNTPPIRERLDELDVAMVKADWTKRDPAITAALATYNRNSVPLYVLIAPNGESRLLPEILTSGIVLDALNELKS